MLPHEKSSASISSTCGFVPAAVSSEAAVLVVDTAAIASTVSTELRIPNATMVHYTNLDDVVALSLPLSQHSGRRCC